MKKNDNVEIIGGKSGYTEIFIEDDLQVIRTEEDAKIIEENLKLIRQLEKEKNR